MISVDLGSSKVVAALGKRSVDNETIVVDIVEKPMEGFTRGEITNIVQVTSAIKEAVEELATRNSVEVKKVWVSVAGKHVVCTNNSGSAYIGGAGGEVTPNDVNKLKDNMDNVQAPEGKIILDRITQCYKVDGEETLSSPVGRFGHQLSTTVNFVLGGKNVLERITTAFNRIDIQDIHYVSGAIASGRVVASDDEKEAGVVVIDFGAGTTDLCIIQNKIVRHIASIPIGSSIINKDICTMAIPANIAEKLKIKCGYATTSTIPAEELNSAIKIKTLSQHQKGKEITYRDLTTIIEARLIDIVEFVIDEIKASGYHDKLTGGIILTGGASKLKGIDTLFRERTGREVRFGGGEQNISFSSVEHSSEEKYATAVGLLDLGISLSDIEPYEEEFVAEPEPEVKEVEVPVTPVGPEKPAEPEVSHTTDTTEKTENTDTPKGPEKPEKPQDPKKSTEKKRGKFRGWLDKTKGKINEVLFGGDVVDDDTVM